MRYAGGLSVLLGLVAIAVTAPWTLVVMVPAAIWLWRRS